MTWKTPCPITVPLRDMCLDLLPPFDRVLDTLTNLWYGGLNRPNPHSRHPNLSVTPTHSDFVNQGSVGHDSPRK